MHPSAMEPLLPPTGGRFETAALELHKAAAALAASAHPITLSALAKLVRLLNSYYSNFIEGVRTTPAEIEAAMRADYSSDPKRAAPQRLAVAHVRVEEAVTRELAHSSETLVTTADFLRRLHRDLYRDVPESERIVRSPTGRELTVVPGELRADEVTIGNHRAPPFASLPALLDRFHEVYRPEAHGHVEHVIAFAASHHRLAWIHPFLDGNGRVTRLMTTCYAHRIGLSASGLWSVARGFARYRKEYYATLAAADEPRRSDFDGRGALSQAALESWCDFVVRVSLDQIEYMRSLLAPHTLADRLRGYAAYRSKTDSWRSEAGDLLGALVLRGEMARGEAMRYLPGKERTSRAALSVLLRDGIVESNSHRASVRLAFPEHVAKVIFPDLVAAPSPTT